MDPERVQRAAAAIDEVARTTRAYGEASVASAHATIREALIQPVDPSALTWNAFQFFEVTDREIYWTKWLASVLSPENSEMLSQLVWRALCDTVQQGSEPEVCDEREHGVLAALDDWSTVRAPLGHGAVAREVHDPALGEAGVAEAGRVDIAIETSNMYVVIENKLDASWHDGDIEQAVKYREFGLKRLKGRQKLGLVLLTKDPDFTLEAFCRDYVRITYWDLARNLRRGLRQSPRDVSSPELWPVLLTIAAIEQDLYGLDIEAAFRARSWRALEHASEIADYLRDTEEHR